MSVESIETLAFQISSLEKSLELPQTGIQRNRAEQILAGLRDRLEQERKSERRRKTINPEGLKRRAALCARLGLSPDTPARQVFNVLLAVAQTPNAGHPAFVENHFSEQDYIDAMEEFVTDPDVTQTERKEAEKLLADLKESFQPTASAAK
jgi:hypothetical protein